MQKLKKGYVFAYVYNNSKGNDNEKKKTIQKCLFRVYFDTWKIHA